MTTNLLNSLSTAQSLLENLKNKIYPLTYLSSKKLLTSSQSSNIFSKIDENNKNLANKVCPSDQMEIQWLKSTIDRLCQDNALLYQEINEILRVVERLGIKYKELKTMKTQKNSSEMQNRIVFLENEFC